MSKKVAHAPKAKAPSVGAGPTTKFGILSQPLQGSGKKTRARLEVAGSDGPLFRVSPSALNQYATVAKLMPALTGTLPNSSVVHSGSSSTFIETAVDQNNLQHLSQLKSEGQNRDAWPA